MTAAKRSTKATPGGVAGASARRAIEKAKAAPLSTSKHHNTIDDATLIAWERDQLDADNYYVIPEFGVAPAQVSFKGFLRPIVSPTTNDDFGRGIRDMVRTLRRLARAQFTSLRELRGSFLSLLDAGFPYLDVGARGFTAQQEAAVRYSVATECLERAHAAWIEGQLNHKLAPGSRDVVQSNALGFYATGANLVLGWLERRPLQRDLQAIARLRQSASKAGERSGNSRRVMSSVASHKDLAHLCRRWEHYVRIEKRDPRTVAGILAREFKRADGNNYTPGYIRKLLKKCETEGRFSRA